MLLRPTSHSPQRSLPIARNQPLFAGNAQSGDHFEKNDIEHEPPQFILRKWSRATEEEHIGARFLAKVALDCALPLSLSLAGPVAQVLQHRPPQTLDEGLEILDSLRQDLGEVGQYEVDSSTTRILLGESGLSAEKARLANRYLEGDPVAEPAIASAARGTPAEAGLAILEAAVLGKLSGKFTHLLKELSQLEPEPERRALLQLASRAVGRVKPSEQRLVTSNILEALAENPDAPPWGRALTGVLQKSDARGEFWKEVVSAKTAQQLVAQPMQEVWLKASPRDWAGPVQERFLELTENCESCQERGLLALDAKKLLPVEAQLELEEKVFRLNRKTGGPIASAASDIAELGRKRGEVGSKFRDKLFRVHIEKKIQPLFEAAQILVETATQTTGEGWSTAVEIISTIKDKLPNRWPNALQVLTELGAMLPPLEQEQFAGSIFASLAGSETEQPLATALKGSSQDWCSEKLGFAADQSHLPKFLSRLEPEDGFEEFSVFLGEKILETGLTRGVREAALRKLDAVHQGEDARIPPAARPGLVSRTISATAYRSVPMQALGLFGGLGLAALTLNPVALGVGLVSGAALLGLCYDESVKLEGDSKTADWFESWTRGVYEPGSFEPIPKA